MEKQICKHLAPLQMLRGHHRKHMRKQILDQCGDDLIHCICDCCLNVLKGNVELTDDQYRKLSRHKKTLRKLADPKTSKKKRKEIIQEGGFLGVLLTPILSALGRLFGGGNG